MCVCVCARARACVCVCVCVCVLACVCVCRSDTLLKIRHERVRIWGAPPRRNAPSNIQNTKKTHFYADAPTIALAHELDDFHDCPVCFGVGKKLGTEVEAAVQVHVF